MHKGCSQGRMTNYEKFQKQETITKMEARFILPPRFYAVNTDRVLAVVSVDTSFGQTGVSVTWGGGGGLTGTPVWQNIETEILFRSVLMFYFSVPPTCYLTGTLQRMYGIASTQKYQSGLKMNQAWRWAMHSYWHSDKPLENIFSPRVLHLIFTIIALFTRKESLKFSFSRVSWPGTICFTIEPDS